MSVIDDRVRAAYCPAHEPIELWRAHREQFDGIAAEHIAIGGDSAGGGLTVALINALCDDHGSFRLDETVRRRGQTLMETPPLLPICLSTAGPVTCVPMR